MAKSNGQRDKSRAARRQGSPSVNIEGTLKTAETATKSTTQNDVLAVRPGAGISKSKKQKCLSRQQRLRKEKGMARAGAVLDKLETKVKESKQKYRIVKERSNDWDEVNDKLQDGRGAKQSKPRKKVEFDEDRMEVVKADAAVNGEAAPTATLSNDFENDATEELDELDGIT